MIKMIEKTFHKTIVKNVPKEFIEYLVESSKKNKQIDKKSEWIFETLGWRKCQKKHKN